MADNKVRFGLEKAYYAVIGDTGEYETPKPLPGAVSLTLDAEGSQSTFYADNVPYVSFSANAGYTGELELAFIEDSVAEDLLGEVKAANGIVYEDAAASPKSFALLFETSGNVNEKRYALYNCKASRPSKNANTKGDSIDPDTDTLSFTAIPTEFDVSGSTKKVVKGVIENTSENSSVYGAWYTSVQKPGAGL